MTDIFLSYSRADRPKAQTMAAALEADGFSVWWDKVLRAGQTYDEVTETMLREARVVIVLWSQTSVKSKWVRAEATLGQRNCELVPAMIEDAERPIMFELVQTADLIGWDGDRSDPRWTDFVEDIQRSLEKAKNQAPALPPTEATAPSDVAPAPPPPPPPAATPPASAPQEAAMVTAQPKKKSSPVPMLLGALIVLGGGGYFAYSQYIAPNASGPDGGDPKIAEPASPECELCPAMTRIEGGVFTIGSPNSERHHSGNETPQTEITLAPYWIGTREVSWDEWTVCVEAGGCRPAQGSGEGDFPVTGISFDDATAYAQWLSDQSGFQYRLPSEAEWEYAARGGTSTAYWWGEAYPGPGVVSGSSRSGATLTTNAYGVSGMLGNVREWAADCYLNSYAQTPVNGRASQGGDCSLRVVRGGSFRLGAAEHRAANRARYRRDVRDGSVGFRVAADQP